MNASDQIDVYIAGLENWRGPLIAKLRSLITEAAPDLSEEWKWNSPTWSKDAPAISISAFKNHVGINFFQGAALSDPDRLFNSGLESKRSRSINLRERDKVNAEAFQSLVRAASKA